MCDFFLWGYLKSHVYEGKPRILEDLKGTIRKQIGIFFNNLDWGPVPRFAPWKHCSQCDLLYNSLFYKRSYFSRQLSLESTTRGSPLAARGGTMGEKWWPNGAWDMHPGFFYMPQICDMGPIILLRFRRKAC